MDVFVVPNGPDGAGAGVWSVCAAGLDCVRSAGVVLGDSVLRVRLAVVCCVLRGVACAHGLTAGMP